MIKLKTGLILGSFVLTLGGILFFKQLQHQSLNKENSFRARLIRFEHLPDGRLAICNLDDQTTLNRIRIKPEGEDWIDIRNFTPLPPSGCGSFETQSSVSGPIATFSALWAGELEARWSEALAVLPDQHKH